MRSLVWHNPTLESLIPVDGYRDGAGLDAIHRELERRGTLRMKTLESGLFPAASVTGSTTGYDNVWVRDNMYVAYSHYVCGRGDIAARVVETVFAFYERHRDRFESIIEGRADPADVMLRPHIRFGGLALDELDEQWPHAQNDALGYTVWLFATLARAGIVKLRGNIVDTLALFPPFLAAIRYWNDEDSGHWEETRKRSASSIGVVVAGLEALAALARERHDELHGSAFDARMVDLVSELAGRGRTALETILPNECVQLSPQQNRRFDAALAFLVHPLGVVTGGVADLILSDIDRFLTGSHGIRRYLGDSYWAPNYDTLVSAENRTKDYSNDIAGRDSLLDHIGQEAQWCIFDPIISAGYGRRYRDTGALADRERQIYHFERSLAQITPEWQCPELYYLKDNEYVGNPHTPLLWTQANLMAAFTAMRENTPR